MIIITITLSILSILILSSTLVLFRNYPYYKKVYNELNKYEFIIDDDLVYTRDRHFVWFIKDNDFKLTKNVYLHSFFVTYCDPYSLYWLIKYKNWFNKNVKSLITIN